MVDGSRVRMVDALGVSNEPSDTIVPSSTILVEGQPKAPQRPHVSRSFTVLLAVATVLAAYVVWPFASPLFLGAVLAVTVHPFYAWLTRRLRQRRLLAASITTALLFVVLVAPLAGIVVIAAGEITSGLAWIRDTVGVHSFADIPSVRLPQNIEQSLDQFLHNLHLTRDDLHTYASRAVEYVQPITQKLVELSVSATMQSVVVLFAFFMFVVDGYRIIDVVADVSPLRPAQTQELLVEFRNVSSAAILGSVLTAVLQGLTIFAGFAVAGVPHAIFFGIVTILTAFVPVIGSMLVWVPAVFILALMSQLATALALALWSFIIIFIIEHAIKPMVLRGKVAMHGGLVLLALLGGLEVFGLVGLIAGPLCFSFFLALLRMYRRDFSH